MQKDEKKEMKWIYEIIVGSIPPFSLLPYRYSILLILQLGPTLRKFRAPLSKDENDVIVQIKIEKMVYWKGPHFKSIKPG